MTPRFALAHACHADWSHAVDQCIGALAGQSGPGPAAPAGAAARALGFVYLGDALRTQAGAILATLKSRTAVAEWVGCSALGVSAGGTDYFDEPAIAVMVGRFPAGSAQVFCGTHRPPGTGSRTVSGASAPASALVHVDPDTPDLPGLVQDMASKIDDGHLFGGVASGRSPQTGSVQIANRALVGGLSGVVFGADVALACRVTQGCHPLPGAQRRRVTKADGNLVLELDGRRAIDVLLEDTGIRRPADAGQRGPDAAALPGQLKSLGHRGLFAGIETDDVPGRSRSNPARDYVIRDVVGVDPARGAIAVSGRLDRDQMMSFCTRDETAARRDLVRICSEIRDEVAGSGRESGSPIAGAIYVSCVARGGQLFGEASEELRIIRSQLGDIPLVGFSAAGEIRGPQLYTHSGVLTVFY